MSKGLKPNQLKSIIEKSIGDINKKFRAELKLIDLPKLILDLINKGISPVAGAVGRFQKYSTLYVDQILGKVKVLTNKKTGGVFVMKPQGKVKKDKVTGADYTPLTKAGKVQREKFDKGLGVGKLRSPVNLKVTGKMHDSLTYNANSGTLTAADEKWAWHNDGEGKLPERRLLPDRDGEVFNRRVQQKISESLIKAIGIKGSKRFLTVNFKIKG